MIYGTAGNDQASRFLPNEYFDYAICYSVFPHLDDKQLAIKNIAEYLKNGGKLAICHSQSREAISNRIMTLDSSIFLK